MVQDFILIPVIDLKGGVVVHARAGERAQYRPIETPLGAAHDPVGIARELLAITGSPALYVADLDAILGTGNHFDMCRELADALPGTDLWIDGGFGDVTDCAFWLPLGANLVVGSESLLAIDNWHDLHAVFGQSLVLSLDFTSDGLRGPQALLSEPGLWPDRTRCHEPRPRRHRTRTGSRTPEGRRRLWPWPRRSRGRRRAQRRRSGSCCGGGSVWSVGCDRTAFWRHHPKRNRRPLAKAAIRNVEAKRPSLKNPASGATAESGPVVCRLCPDLGVLPFSQRRTDGGRCPSSR